MGRIAGARLLVSLGSAILLLAAHRISAMSFEKVKGYADWAFDSAAAVVFLDNERVGFYRDGRLWTVDIREPVQGPYNIEVPSWNYLDDWRGQQKSGNVLLNTYPILSWYDNQSQHFLIYHGLYGEDGSLFWWFDIKKMTGEDVYTSKFSGDGLRTVRDNANVAPNYGNYRVTQEYLPDSDGHERRVSLKLEWELDAEKRIEFIAKGAAAVGNRQIPLDDLEWSDGVRYVFSSAYNSALSLVERNNERDSTIKPIPGVFVLGLKGSIKYEGIVPDTDSSHGRFFRVLGSWGRRLLIVDGSPALELLRGDTYPGKYFTESSNFDAIDRQIAQKPIVNYYTADQALDKSAHLSLFATVGAMRYSEKTLPMRLVAYDPNEQSVADTSLPYYHLYSYYPFAVSPRGNLLAIAEKDPTTGLFKEWGIYRILLDGRIADDKVRYRDGPSTAAKVLGTLKNGQNIKLLDRTDAKEKIGTAMDYWYKVRLSDRREAWVFGAFIAVLD